MDDQLKDKYFKEMVERHLEEFLYLLEPEQKYKVVATDPKMLEHWERVPIFGERIKQRAREAWDEGLKLGEEKGMVVNAETLEDVKKVLATKKHSSKKRVRPASKQKTK